MELSGQQDNQISGTPETDFQSNRMPQSKRAWWTVDRGDSPIVATAIHEGHLVRDDLDGIFALTSNERLYEEDPFTAGLISDFPNRVVFHRSRFEIDINRARHGAIYLDPQHAWGLEVWKQSPTPQQQDASRNVHVAYYEMLQTFLSGIEQSHGQFIVLDVHSYNHRRAGPEAATTDCQSAPDINIGTISMDRDRWGDVVDTLIEHLRQRKAGGRFLDVRENVAFQGKGEQTRFVHERFPLNGCAIAIEFKKFFMEEWTGTPDRAILDDLRLALATALPVLEHTLRERR